MGQTNLPVHASAHTMPAAAVAAAAGSDGGTNIALAASQPGFLKSNAGSAGGAVVIQFAIGRSGRHRPIGAQSTTFEKSVGNHEASSAASIPPNDGPITTGG